ncbi:endonuclease III [Candidatus Pacearchaeota archaeon]|nr:endonuclease III [Candidatus Pacearchaeota archaeon]
MKTTKALAQLSALKKHAKKLRLAADSWDCDWKTLIATLMSARTTDKKTIPTAEQLYKKYSTLKKLSKAKTSDIAKIIRPVNFYKTKAKHVSELSKLLILTYQGKVPHKFEELTELPGVGRKTANVFLAEKGQAKIGVDTHVTYISKYLDWTKHTQQQKIEYDLEKLFPKKYWDKINWILVRFGQTYTSRKEKNRILDNIKRIKH